MCIFEVCDQSAPEINSPEIYTYRSRTRKVYEVGSGVMQSQNLSLEPDGVWMAFWLRWKISRKMIVWADPVKQVGLFSHWFQAQASSVVQSLDYSTVFFSYHGRTGEVLVRRTSNRIQR